MRSRFESEEAALEAAAAEAAAVEAEEADVDAVASLDGGDDTHIRTTLGRPFTESSSYKNFLCGYDRRRTSYVVSGEAWRRARQLGFSQPSRMLVAVCARRIEHERGEAQLPHVPARELPAGTPETAERVWRGFLLLVACWWVAHPGQPVMFTRSFAARWCGVSEDEARGAIASLWSGGFMRRVSLKGRPGIWLPAPPNEDGQA